MKPKRVLFVDPVGEKGGAEVVLLDIVRGLDRARFEPVVACLKPGPLVEEFRGLGVPTFALCSHKTRELNQVARAVVQLRKIIQSQSIDLVHGNGGTMLLYAGLAACLAGRPCVWHVYDPLKGGGLFERAFIVAQRRLNPAWTIFGTPAVAESYLATYRNLRGHSTILPGVDVAQLQRGADARRARRLLDIPELAPVISMFARLQHAKGHLSLIEAVSRVIVRHPEARFVLCGGALFGLEEDYPELLRRRIEESGLRERVSLTGFVSDQDKRDILAASAVVVHPALSEPFGIAVLEAMAAGRPVVATDCVGPAMIVEHDRTGLIVPRGDIEALSAALVAMLDDPERARNMGRHGQQRVLEQFTVEATVQQVSDLYEQVLSPKNAGKDQ